MYDCTRSQHVGLYKITTCTYVRNHGMYVCMYKITTCTYVRMYKITTCTYVQYHNMYVRMYKITACTNVQDHDMYKMMTCTSQHVQTFQGLWLRLCYMNTQNTRTYTCTSAPKQSKHANMHLLGSRGFSTFV